MKEQEVRTNDAAAKTAEAFTVDLSKRNFIRNGLSLMTVLSADSAVAALPDPKVYRNYTQEELDRALDQKLYAPNWREMVTLYEQLSQEAWCRLRPTEHAFGAHEREKLDFYQGQGQASAPLLLMFHGGGWRMMGRRDVAYAAPTFLSKGVAFAAPSYGLLPATSLREMADSSRRAVIWAHRNAERLGIDSRRIYVGGLSAGAQLAGVLLTTDWRAYGVNADAVAGGILVSGIYDVAALAASEVYGYTALDSQDIADLSPIRAAERIRAATLIAWGEYEPPEFARQSRHFLAELRRLSKNCTGLEIAGKTHFEIALDLADPASALSQAALDLIAV